MLNDAKECLIRLLLLIYFGSVFYAIFVIMLAPKHSCSKPYALIALTALYVLSRWLLKYRFTPNSGDMDSFNGFVVLGPFLAVFFGFFIAIFTGFYEHPLNNYASVYYVRDGSDYSESITLSKRNHDLLELREEGSRVKVRRNGERNPTIDLFYLEEPTEKGDIYGLSGYSYSPIYNMVNGDGMACVPGCDGFLATLMGIRFAFETFTYLTVSLLPILLIVSYLLRDHRQLIQQQIPGYFVGNMDRCALILLVPFLLGFSMLPVFYPPHW